MIKINFNAVLTSVFSQYESIEEVKSVANSICAQVKEAYESRYKEISARKSEPSKKKTTEAAPTKATKAVKSKSKTEAPKEVAPKTEPKPASDDDVLIAITDTKAIKKLGLTFERYNDRCWVLRGETKPLRKILKEQFKGVFNSHLTGGEGWVIKTSNAQECANALGIKAVVA